jgi:hypothetical protein
MSEIPTVYCEEIKPRRPQDCETWRFWCDHCNKWHSHGAGAGHRLAHCHKPGSPYERTGYFIELKDSVTA